MVILQKNLPNGIIGAVALSSYPGGPVIGEGKLEKVGSNIIVKIDAAEMPELVTEGFSLGSFAIAEEIDPATIQPFEETSATYGDMVKALEKLHRSEGTFSRGK